MEVSISNKERRLVMMVQEGGLRRIVSSAGQVEVRKCKLLSRSNVPGDSIDEDIHYESTRQKKTMKYLRESCCHRIECSVTNSLTALMRK